MRRTLAKVLETVSVRCSACKKSYRMPTFRYKYNQSRRAKFAFCSYKCRGRIFELIGFKKKKKTTWISLHCFQCKKQFTVSQTNNYLRRRRRTRKTFCSVKCKTALQRRGGALAPGWRGGRHAFPSLKGYITLQVGPNKRMFEHRVVMERHLRRKLQPSEVVHHRNGNRADNRISNLVICKSTGYHSKRYHPRSNAKNGRYLSIAHSKKESHAA